MISLQDELSSYFIVRPLASVHDISLEALNLKEAFNTHPLLDGSLSRTRIPGFWISTTAFGTRDNLTPAKWKSFSNT